MTAGPLWRLSGRGHKRGVDTIDSVVVPGIGGGSGGGDGVGGRSGGITEGTSCPKTSRMFALHKRPTIVVRISNSSSSI